MEDLAVWVIVIGLGILFYMASRMGFREAVTKHRMAGNILIPLSEPIDLKINKLAWSYFLKWSEKVTFIDFQRGYKLTKGELQLSLTVINEPLQRGVVEFLSGPYYDLNEDQKNQLRDHKAHLVIQGIPNKKSSRELVRFLARIMMTLMKEFPVAIGCANASSQSYYPLEKIEPYFTNADFSAEDLYFLFVSVQSVEDQGGFWIHTHGLDQFGVPNLEIFTVDQAQVDYCQSVINNTSVYLIANGDIIRSGNTLEIMGDGVMFKAKLKRKNEFPTGLLHLDRA
jgi:hypothetical protein